MAVGALVSYMSMRAKIKGAKTLDFVGTIPYAVPCTMVAISMILAWSRPPVMLYGTIWVILAAYLVRYMPFLHTDYQCDSSASARFAGGSGARVGAGWAQTMRDVVMPLIRPGLVAGWILVFMPA
jgi:iron(III) transport system permease protein